MNDNDPMHIHISPRPADWVLPARLAPDLFIYTHDHRQGPGCGCHHWGIGHDNNRVRLSRGLI